MRKWVAAILIAIVLFVLQEGQASAAQRNEYICAVGVNDSVLNLKQNPPFVLEHTAYMPIKDLAAAIGASISKENPDGYTIKKGKSWIRYSVKQQQALTSAGKTAEWKAMIRESTLFVPIRSAGEFFGYKVEFLSAGPAVRLLNKGAKMSNEQFISANRAAIKDFYVKKKAVYLTFDDGPAKGMESILDILKNKKAKATFFIIEPQARANPASVKRLVKEGHYPALHSVTHDKNKLYAGNPQNPALEMDKTRKTILSLTGIDSRLARVPYGSKPYMTGPFRDALVQKGYKMWDWNIDTLDWKYTRNSPQTIFDIVKKGLQPAAAGGKPPVILMHVNSGTVSMLPQIIDYLYSQGYECLAYNPDNHFTMNFWKDDRL
ncbi:polysaccharide deacetylase family protein [Bacillus infantis]|uniref:polysaccharide deacetylase n=1 Tax=Bacillus infantis TaxID=324767 RepID=UPI003CFA6D39